MKKNTKENILKNIIIGQQEPLDETVIIDNKPVSIDKAIELADYQIDEMKKNKPVHIHLYWNQKELERCKKIAEYKGLKYQAFIKSILKQAMDKEEKTMTG